MNATSSRSHCLFIIKMHQKDGTHTVLPCWAMLLIPVARQIPVQICAAESSHMDTWSIFWNALFCFHISDRMMRMPATTTSPRWTLWTDATLPRFAKLPKWRCYRCLQDLAGSERASRTGAQAEHLTTWETMGSRWKRGETWGYQESNGEWRAYSQILDHGSYRMFMLETAMDYQTLTSSDTYMIRGTNREHRFRWFCMNHHLTYRQR